jgi:hypothetical protein
LNNRYTYRASFFLVIFAAYLMSSMALKGLSYYASELQAPHGQAWITTCPNHASHIQQATHTLHHYVFSSNESSHPGKMNIIFCSTSLQMIPAQSNFFINPDQHSYVVQGYHSNLASQLFVFRDPDPPRFFS